MAVLNANPAAVSVFVEKIATSSGMELLVERQVSNGRIELLLRAQTNKRCVLHWGVRRRDETGWRILPHSSWPEGTSLAGADAMRTPFKPHNGESRVSIALPSDHAPELIEFALFFPDEGRWDNHRHQNYQVAVSEVALSQAALQDLLQAQRGPAEVVFEKVFEVESAGQIALEVDRDGQNYHVHLASNIAGPLVLYWGIARRSPQEWLLPPDSWRPPGSVSSGTTSAQTPFEIRDGCAHLELALPLAEAPLGLAFVLKQGAQGRWLKHRDGNFYVPITISARQAAGLQSDLTALGGRIVQAEMNSGSWTLMHRFNLCFDLLESTRGRVEAFALLFVWLRFSAMRQLTWQRNFNTKPRELAHSQDRLTGRLADLYGIDPLGRPFVRLMLATVGRGGDGQRIRDEILQIMHRHHVKEVSGHFLEEWHQKLHNNTTPDDIVICEAYLEFLRSNGNQDRFYETLQNGGVTRDRLASFERPIRSNPDFVPHLKDGLIHDFGNFLKILRAVHSGTDLETAINAARDRLDGGTQDLLWRVWNHRNDSVEGLGPLLEQITSARRGLSHRLHSGQDTRSLLYLDLALEQLVRVAVERNLHQHLRGDPLVDLVGWVLENVTLSYEHRELGACLRHWERLAKAPPEPRWSPGWSLHARSVVDRIGRALGDWSDRLYQLLQPKAEYLGQAFHAETWTITLFSEEVVRGSSLGFALSMLLHQLDRALRQSAHLGDWQIVSRGQGTGQVEVVDALRTVQNRQFPGATVVIADKVMGDEELPKEIVAVIAPDVTDLVSHVAVRARNAKVLFASCSDSAILEQLKSLRGKFMHLEVTSAGDVLFKEVERAQSEPAVVSVPSPRRGGTRPKFVRFALTMDEFNERVVGSKSLSQARLRGRLPAWVAQPAMAALPFGVFEETLARRENLDAAQRHRELVERAKPNPTTEALSLVRQSIDALTAPAELKTALQQAMTKTGLPWPEDWSAAWGCIKRVWASKWNERAVLSRKRMGLPDENLFMAVLVQRVVQADYAFVIHTVNPSNNHRDELYAEVVLGLGETLVGNFPGRALSFTWDKQKEQSRLISFPGKSIGLYGGGLIFRSDSNGEDLAGYAGAGLYDSVLLSPPREEALDYSEEPLVWDEPFRNGLLAAIARIGTAIESSLSSPQDIEGAVAKGSYYVVQTRPQVGLPNPS